MTSNFHLLDDWTRALLTRVRSTERAKLFGKIASELQKKNRARIRSQKNVDGSAYEPRQRERKIEKIDFIYRKTSGERSKRSLRSHHGTSDSIIGRERQGGRLKSFRRDRIVKVLSRHRISHKSAQRMMLGISRRMKRRSHPDGLTLDFGRDRALNRIASVHQFGKREAVGARQVTYPARSLLGFGAGDKELIETMIAQHLRQSA